MAILEKAVNNFDPFADRVGTGLAAPGTFVAVIEDIVDEMDVERRKFQSEELERVNLTCFLFQYRDNAGKVNRISSRRMKISGHEQSTLFGFLKSILGRAPKMGWDYLELRGHRCLITVEHLPRRDGNGVYAAIASLSPLPAGMGGGREEVRSAEFGVRSEATVRALSPAPVTQAAMVPQAPPVDTDEEFIF